MPVAVNALTLDGFLAGHACVGNLPERLSRGNIRDMHFHCGDAHSLQCVQNGHGGMGVGSGIDDDTIDLAVAFLNLVHKAAFMVGLVLLDFNVYGHPQSSARVLVMRELYNKYAAQGLEIFQVSLDENEHFWKTAVENIPWVCVRSEDAPYTKEANLYGVRELPTYFLINRNGELVKRDEMVEDLEKEIQQLLEK